LSEFQFARASLEAQGLVAPDSPEAEALVQSVIKEVIMHEVGHTLGLKHNFKASTVYTQAQLRDAAFVQANGIGSSVMDYNAYNLPLPGEARSGLFNSSVGPYDLWAIEYAYKPLDPKAERAELERIASRSTEPLLAFADDMDAGGFGNFEGFDPKANRFDLGSEPLEFFERRLKLTQELWKRAETWPGSASEGTLRQRNMLAAGFGQLRNAAALTSKYVGGMNAVREVPGTPAAAGRKAAFVPVPAEQQRRALQFLAKGLFSADSFRLPASLLANVLPDYVDFTRREPISITGAVLRVQTTALDRLMAAGTAQRVLDASQYVSTADGKASLLSLNEVYATLQGAVWSELGKGGEIEPLRRNLQREHLRRVQALLLRGPAMLQPDALSLVRWHANELKTQLEKAGRNAKLSVETRAHLADSQTLLAESLKATFQRL
jgi:Met-zincin